MSMNDYIRVLQATYQTPNESMRAMQQAIVDTDWENTTLLEIVQEEINHGSFTFNPIEVWKNSISEFSVNIIKDEKDYRRLMFRDTTHEVERGRFYNFDDNYWLVYTPTNNIEPYCDVHVRRCNNMAKWIDKDTNVLHELPCVLEYEASSPSPKVDKDIITPNNGTVLVLQGNQDTIKLKVNQRFIFNGRPFKITGYNNYMQDDYVTKDTPLLFFDIYLDEELPTDDIINGTANRYEYNYQVNILENPIENVKGFSGKLSANVTLNNNIVDIPIEWSCNQNATINQNGEYVLVGEVDTIATITASFGDASESVDIKIVSSVVDNLDIVISPDVKTLKQSRSVVITADLYKNGIKQNDIVNAIVVGADSLNCYNWVSQGNNVFVLTNKLRSVKPLVITFTSGEITKSISIELNAMY